MVTDRLKEQEQINADGYQGRVYETLKFAYLPYIRGLSLIIFLGFIGRMLLLGNANLIGWWVDGKVDLEIENLLWILTAMAVTGSLLTLFFRVWFSRLSAKAVSQIYDEVTLRTSRYPMSFFDTTPAGRIITRFSSDYGNVFRLFGGPLAEFFSIVFDLVAMLLLITLASPLFLIFVVLVSFLNYFVYRANRDRLRILRRDLSASRSPSIAHFAETTQGASTIRSFRREQDFKDRFDGLDAFFIGKKKATVRGLISFSFQMNSLSALLLLLTGMSSILFVSMGWVSIGAVGVAFAFIVMSGNTMQMFFEWLAQIEEAMIGVERLDRYLRLPIEEGSLLPAKASFPTGHRTYTSEQERRSFEDKITRAAAAEVEVKNLWFRYRDSLPWVLKDLNFKVRAGERLGIVGRTGSGKSSLIQAIFRLYPVEKGEISINGVQARLAPESPGEDLKVYRRSIAFIAQDPVLFQGTLLRNLDLEGRHSLEACNSALRRVGLSDWIRADGSHLQMRIEERGKNLSMGERQLLCMARCLLQEAPVIVMDEATSAVDPQSEEILLKATEEFFEGRTQILIAHRLSTLLKCDRILWLDNGEIKALGPTAEVLEKFQESGH